MPSFSIELGTRKLGTPLVTTEITIPKTIIPIAMTITITIATTITTTITIIVYIATVLLEVSRSYRSWPHFKPGALKVLGLGLKGSGL